MTKPSNKREIKPMQNLSNLGKPNTRGEIKHKIPKSAVIIEATDRITEREIDDIIVSLIENNEMTPTIFQTIKLLKEEKKNL